MDSLPITPKTDWIVEAEPVMPMTKEQFLDWQTGNDVSYEWGNGLAIKTTGMGKDERCLVSNIQEQFARTRAFGERARLFEETDCWLTDAQMRRPDMALFSRLQIVDTDTDHVSAFVVEIISPTDKVKDVEQKVIEYLQAGVQVVWHLIPDLRMVRVFTSLRHMKTCFDDDEFDAAPAVRDLQLTVDQLFSVQ